MNFPMLRNVVYPVVFLSLAAINGYSLTMPYIGDMEIKLDGRLDEKIWTAPPTMEALTVYRTDRAEKALTQVWMAVSKDNLHLAVRCSEPMMDKVKASAWVGGNDLVLQTDDSMEFFLATPGMLAKGGCYAQIAFSLSGAISDTFGSDLGGRDINWTSRAQMAAFKGADFWSMEATIPLSSFMRQNVWAASPVMGDVWGVNVARNRWPEEEVSSHVPVKGTFHDSKELAPLAVAGDLLPLKCIGIDALDLASANVQLELAGTASASLNISESLRLQGGEKKFEWNLAPGAKGELRLVTETAGVADAPFQVEALRDGTVVYWGKTVFDRYDPVDAAKKLVGEYKNAIQILSGSGSGIKRFSDEKAIISERLKELEKAFTEASSGDNTAKRKLAEIVRTQNQDARTLESVRAITNWALLKTAEPFAVTEISALRHATPVTIDGARCEASAATVQMAAGEAENVQLLVVPMQEEQEIKATVEGTAEIEAKISKLAYLRPSLKYPEDKPSSYYGCLLMEADDQKILPGFSQAYYVTLRAKPDSLGKSSTVKVHFTSGDKAVTIPIPVKVWNFALPEKPTLLFWTWAGPGHLKQPDGSPIRRWGVDDYRNLFDLLDQYRMADELHLNTEVLLESIKVKRILPDGNAEFDFSGLKPYMKLLREAKMPLFNPNFGPAGFRWFLQPNRYPWGPGDHPESDYPAPIVEETGKPLFDLEIMPNGPGIHQKIHAKVGELMKNPPPYWYGFWTQYQEFLRSEGVLDKAWYAIYDEPGGQYVHYMAQDNQNMRKAAPDIQLTTFGISPSVAELKGLVDAWSPDMRVPMADGLKRLQAERAEGVKIFPYICGNPDRDGDTPDTWIDKPGMWRRIMPWMVYRFGFDGWFYYMFTEGGTKMEISPDARFAFPKLTVDFPGAHNELRMDIPGLLFVRPQGKAPLYPSQMINQARDGQEDHDYIVMLKEVRAKMKNDPATASQIDRILGEIDTAITDAAKWNRDESFYRKLRQEMGDVLDRQNPVSGQGE
ncbi:MAG: glycoside hydrolase domain-containing protein [Terrimicrobiaceae bacterium]